jgi:hypothetical protein
MTQNSRNQDYCSFFLYNGMIRTRKNKDETYGSRSTTLQYTVCGQRSNTKIQKQVYIY